MGVTVVVTGIPRHIPLKSLGREFDSIFDTDEIGSFRVRELNDAWSSTKRRIALDFSNGFDAMAVQQLLDDRQCELSGNVYCILKARILSGAKENSPQESMALVSSSSSTLSRRGFGIKDIIQDNDIPKDIIEKANNALDVKLNLLKKQRQILKAERKILKEQRKLKKYDKEDESDSNNETKVNKKKNEESKFFGHGPHSKTSLRHHHESRSSERESLNASISYVKREKRPLDEHRSLKERRSLRKHKSRSPREHGMQLQKQRSLRSPERSSSPDEYRSQSQNNYIARSPTRFRSRSPNKYRMRSSKEFKSRSTNKYKSRSPTRFRSRSPTRFRSRSPNKYRIRSSKEFKSRSPNKYKSRSPTRFKSRSPTRYRSRSPNKYISRSTNEYRKRALNRYRSRSPNKYNSRSTNKRRKRSPSRYSSCSPTKYISRSPTRNRSRSPTKYRSRSPSRFRSRSSNKYLSLNGYRTLSPTRYKTRSPNDETKVGNKLTKRHNSNEKIRKSTSPPLYRVSKSPELQKVTSSFSVEINQKEKSNIGENKHEKVLQINQNKDFIINRKSKIAFQQVILELELLIRNETFNSYISHGDRKKLSNNVENIVKNRFNNLSISWWNGKAADELVKYYRTQHSFEDDKKLVKELVGECEKPPVLLTEAEDVKTLHVNQDKTEKPHVICVESEASYGPEEIVSDKNLPIEAVSSDHSLKTDPLWTAVDAVLQDVKIDELQAISTNEQDNLNRVFEQSMDMDDVGSDLEDFRADERDIPENSQYAIPTRILMRQMKKIIDVLKANSKYLYHVTRSQIQERLKEMMKGKQYTRSCMIVKMYREIYDKRDDETFLEAIVEDINNGKYELLAMQFELKNPEI